ncbi:MAG: diacylglycerol kinase family protein [Caldilineales bacterium]|nr:diacylglycerol kinase family protein [Caldilineales bacterium]MDW8318755.1 diacylglycerol kinase family protein [Anaerolineae bacterium]
MSHEAQPLRSRSRWHSFTCAVRGALHTLRTQRNAWIELAAAVVVVGAGLWLGLQPAEWAVVLLTIFVVLALEAVNSAVEAAVDLASPQYHELARVAKDCAAGAMLFAVLGAIGVAAAVFGPRLLALF